MKSMPRLPIAFAVCATLVLLSPGLLRAADDDSAARRTQAEALLNAMHTEQVLTNATARVHQLVDNVGKSAGAKSDLSPEQKAAEQKAQAEAHEMIAKQLSWDAVKGDFIQAYADAFTEDELKGLVAFYSSPLGQKLVQTQPQVTEKMGKLTQQKAMAVVPAVLQKIKESTQKPPAASPSPAVGTSIPAAPSTPSAPASPAPSATTPKP